MKHDRRNEAATQAAQFAGYQAQQDGLGRYDDPRVHMDDAKQYSSKEDREMGGPERLRRYAAGDQTLEKAAKDELFLNGRSDDEVDDDHPGPQRRQIEGGACRKKRGDVGKYRPDDNTGSCRRDDV